MRKSPFYFLALVCLMAVGCEAEDSSPEPMSAQKLIVLPNETTVLPSGGSFDFMFKLNAAPRSAVTVNVTTDSEGIVQIGVPSIPIEVGDWQQMRSVRVTCLPQSVGGTQVATLRFMTSSVDIASAGFQETRSVVCDGTQAVEQPDPSLPVIDDPVQTPQPVDEDDPRQRPLRRAALRTFRPERVGS